MTHPARHTRLRAVALLAIVVAVLAGAFLLRGRSGGDGGADQQVTKLGRIEVTAELAEIPGLAEWKGAFPDQGYDYVYIVKYRVERVHRGQIDGDTILVGHYNPLKPRGQVADARCPDIGGNVAGFRVGDVHRLALEVPIDDHYMGPIINKYFGQPDAGRLYWAVWTNRVSP